jgi:MFS family permease
MPHQDIPMDIPDQARLPTLNDATMTRTSFFSKESIYAPPGFNRWRIPPASIAIHLCIGSAYAWSIFNPALVKLRGVVTSAADDWTLAQVVWIFTVAIVLLGLSAAVAGKWLERVGPRTVGLVAALCWSGGFVLSSLGIRTHQLWLLYLGYGVIGGCGLGLGYVSPVSTLIRWFPDRRGMAAGMAIMGFGGGAIIAAPLQEGLIRAFYQAPEYLGTVDEVRLTTEGGKRFAEGSGGRREVVVVGANEVAQMLVPGKAGVYVVGTGTTGASETFLVLGAAYFVVMTGAAMAYRLPAPGWQPAGWTPGAGSGATKRLITAHDVDSDEAIMTPQFYLLWIILCFNVTAGIGVLGVAKTMMSEIFGSALPQIVNSSFAATYVLMISLFNMLGRFFWASASDYIGRKPTYTIFFGAGVLLYLSIPWIAQRVSVSPSVTLLVVFYAVTMLIFTMYGGGFATIPAYLADLFGTRQVGAIHGRLLTAWSTAGVLGPLAITALRQNAELRAIGQLAERVSASEFAARFGALPDQLPLLIKQKTVTIAKLLELAPAGTADPSCTLYNSTMVLMAGLLAVGLAANLMVRPVAEKHHASM